MIQDASGRGGIPAQRIKLMNDALKSALCVMTHLKHSKKIKGVGPPANSEKSKFDLDGT